MMADDGHNILKDNVSRIFPSDNSRPHPPGDTVSLSLLSLAERTGVEWTVGTGFVPVVIGCQNRHAHVLKLVGHRFKPWFL